VNLNDLEPDLWWREKEMDLSDVSPTAVAAMAGRLYTEVPATL
jgi:hypothetical protein